jgi:putative DNA methylase
MKSVRDGVSTQLAALELPAKNSRRLIDRGMLRFEASVSGLSERYRRGETSHTVHVWWARRPHAAMRALVFSCLSHDDSNSALERMAKLAARSAGDGSTLEMARKACRNGSARPPRTLDMFGGGGTIPYECAFLGAEAYSIDSNELSVFVQRCLLVYAQSLGVGRLKRLIEVSGKSVIGRIRELTVDLFPARGTVATYIWSYSIECPACGFEYSLSKRPWLSRRNGKRLALEMKPIEGRDQFNLGSRDEDWVNKTRWLGRNGTSKCPKCNAERERVTIKQCNDRMIAVSEYRSPKGKGYRLSAEADFPAEELVARIEREALEFLEEPLPTSALPRWSGIVNPALYGIETHADVYNSRQRATLLVVLQALAEEFDKLLLQEGEQAAKAGIGLLSALVDQSVDWNSRLSMWISQNEQVGRAFCGPGIAMMWDYAETDPVGRGPSNLEAKLERIVAGCDALLQLPAPVDVRKSYAQELPFEDGFFDAVITDPPYYDNIFYNILADFFYAWKRLLLRRVEPVLFLNSETDSTRELVASSRRSGSKVRAHSEYCEQLTLAIAEAERVLSSDGVFSLVYSHSSLNGWEALIRAYRSSGMKVTGVEPLSIERKQRPRAVTSEAVNTCMVFFARKSDEGKKWDHLDQLLDRFRQTNEETIAALRKSGWVDKDCGIAGFSQGVGMLMNLNGVFEKTSDHAVMRHFERIVQEMVPAFKVTGRGSL